MPDDFDRAQELEQLQRDQALQKQLNRPVQAPLLIDGIRCCRDCEDAISERVKILPHAVRCVHCQNIYERQQ
jgi:phage/conjugal plasmid C-4 type zinc finger TraR family protein